MTRTSLPLAALAFAMLAGTPGLAFAGEPAGLWLTEDGDAKMKVSHCGGAICGNIAWLKQPNDESGRPKVDKNNADAGKRGRPCSASPIILAMKPDGGDRWSGQVYNAEDGKTYNGSFTLAGANKAQLQGLRRHHLQDQDLDADATDRSHRTAHRARWPNSTARTFGIRARPPGPPPRRGCACRAAPPAAPAPRRASA